MRIATDLFFIILLGILIIYFTSCDKPKEGSSTLGLYCPDQHEEYTVMCQKNCNGDWVRLIGDAEIYFETEQECRQ